MMNTGLSDDVTEINLWMFHERRNKSCYETGSYIIDVSYTFCRCNRSHA